MKEQWTEDFKDKLSGFEAKAPEGLLDGIKKQMAAQGALPLHEQKRSKGAHIILRRALVALAAAAAIVGAIFLLPTRQHEVTTSDAGRLKAEGTPQRIENTIGTPQKGQSPTLASELRATATHWLSRLYDHSREIITAWTGGKRKTMEAVRGESGEAQEPLIASTKRPAVVAEAEKPMTEKPSENAMSPTQQHVAGANSYEYRSAAGHSRWQVSAYCNGAGSGRALSEQQITLNAAAPYGYYTEDMTANSVLRQGVSEDANLTSEHHNQPVKWGVTVSYKLNSRWSLQTGVTYSYLKSTFTHHNGQQDEDTEQRLHYVGVPVSVSYSIWHNRYLNVYATTGGEVERLVKGKADSQGKGLGNQTVPVRRNIKDSRPVFSVNAAAGIELHTSPSISFYAEPGVSRHFNNGNGVRSAYTSKPTNLSISVGVRVNLNK